MQDGTAIREIILAWQCDYLYWTGRICKFISNYRRAWGHIVAWQFPRSTCFYWRMRREHLKTPYVLLAPRNGPPPAEATPLRNKRASR